MRKLYATFLLSLLLISNLSLGSVQHYCDGHLMDSQIQWAHFNSLSCGMDSDKYSVYIDESLENTIITSPSLEQKIQASCDFENNDLKSNSCCENKSNFLVLNNLKNVEEFALNINPTFFVSWIATFLLPVEFHNPFQSSTTQLQDFCVTPNLNILFQVFII